MVSGRILVALWQRVSSAVEDSTYSGFSGIVETEEEQFGMLVGQAQVGEQVPDCNAVSASAIVVSEISLPNIHQSMTHMAVARRVRNYSQSREVCWRGVTPARKGREKWRLMVGGWWLCLCKLEQARCTIEVGGGRWACRDPGTLRFTRYQTFGCHSRGVPV